MLYKIYKDKENICNLSNLRGLQCDIQNDKSLTNLKIP